MAKLSKQKIKLHEEAMELIKKDTLTITDRDFVFENYQPSYDHNVGQLAAFFTPLEMTYSVAMYCPDSGTVVDIAAGIGGLSRAIIDAAKSNGNPFNMKVVCIERNPRFVEVGKKLVPEAKWIQGDVYDQELWNKLGKFDYAVSNPPFGNIGQDKSWPKYTGVADLMALGVAMEVASAGTFILPQASVPFEYSGKQTYTPRPSKNFDKFLEQYPSCRVACSSIDTGEFEKEWVDASPKVEIITFEKCLTE